MTTSCDKCGKPLQEPAANSIYGTPMVIKYDINGSFGRYEFDFCIKCRDDFESDLESLFNKYAGRKAGYGIRILSPWVSWARKERCDEKNLTSGYDVDV